MKHNLGSLLLYLFIVLHLQAEDFSYTASVNTSSPYKKESVVLDIDIKQTNPDVLLLFQFEVLSRPSYRVELIDSNQDLSHYHTHIHYRYLIHALKEGNVSIEVSLTKRVTDEDKVAYFASGDRDDFKKLETINYPIDISPLVLHVKPLPKGVDVVGDFHLSSKVHSKSVKPYEPVPLTITLEGRGYPPLLDQLFNTEQNLTFFSEKPVIKQKSDHKGIQFTIIYKMAFSHDKDFSIPALSLHAFNPKTGKNYLLHTPSYPIHVSTVNKENLLDAHDVPALKIDHWEWLMTTLSYLLVFLAGFLSAQFLKWRPLTRKRSPHPLVEKIQQSKTHKALLALLLSTEDRRFTALIQKLEATLYGDETYSLKILKKEALENIV